MPAAWAPVAGAVIGGLFSSKDKTSTQQSSTTPWVGAQSGLNTLYGQAENNFYSGGPEYYPGQTVASQSAPTQMGQQAMYARAMQGSPVLSGAQDQVGRTMNDEYLYSNPALSGLMDASNFNAMGMDGMGMLSYMGNGGMGDFYGQQGLNYLGAGGGLGTTDGLQGLNQIGAGSQIGSTLGMNSLNQIGQGGALGSTSNMSDLQRIGSGANIGRTPGSQQLAAIGNGSMLNANPYMDQMFSNASRAVGQQFSNNVMPGIASMFAGAGRYGSEGMQSGMSDAQNNYGDTLNRLAGDMYGQNYANERTHQQGALNSLANIGLQERGQQLQGAQAAGQLSQNEIAQMMQGATQAGQFSQNERAQQIQSLLGAGNLSSAEQGRMLQALQSAGQLDATNRQQQLGALNTLTGNQLQGQSLKNQALGTMSDAHGRERQLQMAAAQLAPGLAQADYFDINQMLNLGQQQDQFAQQNINADMQRWDFNQNQNNNQLLLLNQLMKGAGDYKASNSSVTQPGNVMNGALGGMMMGSQVGPQMGGLFSNSSNVYSNTGPGDPLWGMDLGQG